MPEKGGSSTVAGVEYQAWVAAEIMADAGAAGMRVHLRIRRKELEKSGVRENRTTENANSELNI